MTKVKKIGYVLASFFLVPSVAFGEAIGESPSGGFSLQLRNPLKVDTVIELLKALLGIMIQIGLPLAAIAIIYSGFLMVTAQGNEEKLGTAKKAFGYAVLGTLILLGAWVIITAIENTIKLLQ